MTIVETFVVKRKPFCISLHFRNLKWAVQKKKKSPSCLGNKTFIGSSENMLDWGGECGRLNSQSSRCTFHLGSDGPLAYLSQRDLVHGGLQDVLWESLNFPSKMDLHHCH